MKRGSASCASASVGGGGTSMSIGSLAAVTTIASSPDQAGRGVVSLERQVLVDRRRRLQRDRAVRSAKRRRDQARDIAAVAGLGRSPEPPLDAHCRHGSHALISIPGEATALDGVRRVAPPATALYMPVPEWACSSVVEHCVDIAGVASSILATPTIFLRSAAWPSEIFPNCSKVFLGTRVSGSSG